MPSLAITGNLGSGKSTALALFAQLLRVKSQRVVLFSADQENRRLLDENREVQAQIRSAFGEGCFTQDGMIDRERLFVLITSSQTAKVALEHILHPRLEALWKPLADEHRGNARKFFLAEIPLLFEKGLDRFFDASIVVACSESIRRERLGRERSLPPEKVTAWLALQQGQDQKIVNGMHLLWNDGSADSLKHQISIFLSNFQ